MHLQAPVGPLQLPATLVDKAVRLDGNFKPKLPPPKTKTKKNPEIQRRDRLLSKFVARSIAPATTATVCCYVAPVLVLPFFSLLFLVSFFPVVFGLTAYPACVYARGLFFFVFARQRRRCDLYSSNADCPGARFLVTRWAFLHL